MRGLTISGNKAALNTLRQLAHHHNMGGGHKLTVIGECSLGTQGKVPVPTPRPTRKETAVLPKPKRDDGDLITQFTVKSKAGHDLRFFYNATSGLLVIDLNHKERAGGNEIVRQVLNEEALLAHCAKLPAWEDA